MILLVLLQPHKVPPGPLGGFGSPAPATQPAAGTWRRSPASCSLLPSLPQGTGILLPALSPRTVPALLCPQGSPGLSYPLGFCSRFIHDALYRSALSCSLKTRGSLHPAPKLLRYPRESAVPLQSCALPPPLQVPPLLLDSSLESPKPRRI